MLSLDPPISRIGLDAVHVVKPAKPYHIFDVVPFIDRVGLHCSIIKATMAKQHSVSLRDFFSDQGNVLSNIWGLILNLQMT